MCSCLQLLADRTLPAGPAQACSMQKLGRFPARDRKKSLIYKFLPRSLHSAIGEALWRNRRRSTSIPTEVFAGRLIIQLHAGKQKVFPCFPVVRLQQLPELPLLPRPWLESLLKHVPLGDTIILDFSMEELQLFSDHTILRLEFSSFL